MQENGTGTSRLPEEAKEPSIDYREMTVEERGKFQRAQVDKFCEEYEELVAENGNPEAEVFLDRQMLVSDKARTAYCYVPKAGCTTQKVLLFLTLGVFPPSIIKNKTKHPQEGYIELGINKYSFMAKDELEKENILKNYYKYMMYRNPAERLVSGYLSKVLAFPLIGFEDSKPERNWLRKLIYKYNHEEEYERWASEGGKVPITITFPDFIKYWLATHAIHFDEHFRPAFELCRPCQVRYSYYGNFNAFNEEVAAFSDRIRGNLSHLLDEERRKEGPTESVAPKYYQQLTNEEKIGVVEMLAVELNFYYAVFPPEKDSHKAIMGLDYEVPSLMDVLDGGSTVEFYDKQNTDTQDHL